MKKSDDLADTIVSIVFLFISSAGGDHTIIKIVVNRQDEQNYNKRNNSIFKKKMFY